MQSRIIKTTADKFNRYARLHRAEKAIARLKEAAQAELGLPESTIANLGQWVIVDGNGLPIGKFTVSEIPEAVITRKAHCRGRIS